MHRQHPHYNSAFHLCIAPSVFACTALHIFFPPPVTADYTDWYNFLPALQSGSHTTSEEPAVRKGLTAGSYIL